MSDDKDDAVKQEQPSRESSGEIETRSTLNGVPAQDEALRTPLHVSKRGACLLLLDDSDMCIAEGYRYDEMNALAAALNSHTALIAVRDAAQALINCGRPAYRTDLADDIYTALRTALAATK